MSCAVPQCCERRANDLVRRGCRSRRGGFTSITLDPLRSGGITAPSARTIEPSPLDRGRGINPPYLRSRYCCRGDVAVAAVVRAFEQCSPVGLLSPRPYRPFSGGSRATIRSLRSPTFTRNGLFAIFFPCRQAAAFLARQQDRSARHPPLTLRARGCRSVVAALKDRHQGRDGRGLGNSNRRSLWLRLAPSPAPKTRRGSWALPAVQL